MSYDENGGEGGGWEQGVIRGIKVRQIFETFDGNKDGGLDRKEMARLVMAVNPKVKFKDEQIEAILDEVFRTYGEFIQGEAGLSLDGLQRTYDDGAGDVDRDFQALGLVLKLPEGMESSGEQGAASLPDISENAPLENLDVNTEIPARGQDAAAGPQAEDKGGYEFLSTKRLMDELEGIVAYFQRGNATVPLSGSLVKALDELRRRTDSMSPEPSAAIEAHMAAARLLMKVGRADEASKSLVRAVSIDPNSVRANFLLGNSFYSIGKLKEARHAYERSLDSGRIDPDTHASILPQVRASPHARAGTTFTAFTGFTVVTFSIYATGTGSKQPEG